MTVGGNVQKHQLGVQKDLLRQLEEINSRGKENQGAVFG